MAEAAGLALGVVALAGVFKDCIDLFSYIEAARELGSDFKLLETRLDVEKTLLLQWAERVGLVSGERDQRLCDAKTQPAVNAILESMRLLLGESEELQNRYGLSLEGQAMAKTHQPRLHVKESTSEDKRLGDRRRQRFLRAFGDLTVHDNDYRQFRKTPTINKIRWAIRDKDKFEDLVQKLSDFVAKLNALVPHQQKENVQMVKEDIRSIANSVRLEVLGAATGRRDLVADEAAKALDDSCRRRILDAIWYRKMDDRRNDVSTPFAGTYRWAFESCGAWSDLTSWLRSGSAIYWFSGKAGSGKSTIMKFLYSHSTTRQLLEEWAENCKLTIGDFFFWGLGSEEQKSLTGLTRAILYEVLESDHSLIQLLLPNMWRYTYGSDDPKISPPSPAEIQRALTRMASLDQFQTRKYCFFIDGLDEYSGRYSDGISFITTLAEMTNIKFVVSSRPISECVQAFSSKPLLQLQDLTEGDIQKYVDGVIGTHPYMIKLLDADEVGATTILTDVVSKASGVFLWVILACQSLLQGFGACDRIPELRARVDELPEELQDLFQYMLLKIDRRYQAHAARMLRLRYVSYKRTQTIALNALGMALFDEFDVWGSNDLRLQCLTMKEKVTKCELLEGRLTSRCLGLLEVHLPEPDQPSTCICNTFEEHSPLVDSSVEFLQRSLFEFLDEPSVWQLEPLTKADEHTETYAALSFLYLILAEVSSMGLEEGKDTWAVDSILGAMFGYAMYGDYFGAKVDEIGMILLRFRAMMSNVPVFFAENSYWLWYDWKSVFVAGDDVETNSTLLLAVESGMVSFVSRCFEAEEVDVATRRSRFPLLGHALFRTSGQFLQQPIRLSSVAMVRLLLSRGSDPNEDFRDKHGIRTTPWLQWLQKDFTKYWVPDSTLIDIATALVEAGADLGSSLKNGKSVTSAIQEKVSQWKQHSPDDHSSWRGNCRMLLDAIEARQRQKPVTLKFTGPAVDLLHPQIENEVDETGTSTLRRGNKRRRSMRDCAFLFEEFWVNEV
ncbi:hypothetical protein H2200_013025 [Cladophialophora chaetospira]|uniref:Prion-inhibition and propagation HeLo domain-containing protein n=1 Tax=Cladophialophora chaetospira TaxID=386627 RepID=A0AA39CBR5_9EURO|nr:hypothetical protein H2200_013025 [Cladophialophora chaetospira]